VSSSQVRDNSLTSRDIKDRSLTGRDLRSNTITGRVVGNLSGRDLLDDSIDGTDVAEDSLATVPRSRSAAQADRAIAADVADALAGSKIQRVSFAKPAGTEAAVLDLGGLHLKAKCSTANALTILAGTSGNGWIRVSGTMQRTNTDTVALLIKDDDFRPADEFSLLPDGADNAAGQLVYLAADGGTVTVTFLAEQGIPAARGFACLFTGTAVQAAG
jgi:hypothetical protein